MTEKNNYLPHFDTLRFFAAFLVVAEHFFHDWGIVNIGFGRYGVDIFFAISGFLITGILLKSNKNKNRMNTLKVFFVRRILRLFPAYYLLLFSLIVISLFTGLWIFDNQNFAFYVTYTSNILFYLKGYQSTILNHTWSLGIEEQFYLLWPFIILFTKKKYIFPVVLSFLLLGLLSRTFFSFSGDINFLPIGNFHTLGVGAFLALVFFNKKDYVSSFLGKYNLLLFLLSSLTFTIIYPIRSDFLLLHDLCIVFISLILVYNSYNGFNGVFKIVFDNKILQGLGKISYGIYLYHKPIPLILIKLFNEYSIHLNPSIGFLISIILTIFIAKISWLIFENPILQFKKRYRYY